MKRRSALVILVAALLAGALAGWLMAKPYMQSTLGTAAGDDPKGRVNLLLLGADERPGELGRSDTAILVSADLDAKKVSLISLPRDTWVNIPGRGWDKLGHAFAYGEEAYELALKKEKAKPAAERKPVTERGEHLTLKTVNGLLNVQVDHYLVVNMQGFVKIVDSLGGVTIDVEKDLNYDDPYDTPPLHIHLKKGVQTLNGADALKYVRFRHDADSDFGRMKRQQTFLRALMEEALKPKNLPKLPNLANQLYGAIRTDLSKTDMLRLGMAMAKGLQPGAMESSSLVAVADHTFGGVYFLEINLLESRQAAYQALHGTPADETYLAKARDDQKAYKASLAAEQQRQEALAKAAEEAAKKAAEEAGQNPDGTQPGQPGEGGVPGEPGTAPAPFTSTVLIIDASGKKLAGGYAKRFTQMGLDVEQVATSPQTQKATQIIVDQPDAASLQKVLSLLPGTPVVMQPAPPGAEHRITVILGSELDRAQ